MTKLNIKMILLSLAALVLLSADLHGQNDIDKTQIGRDDPFASFPVKQVSSPKRLTTVPQQIMQIQEPAPELFVETVMLKSIDAKTIEPVLATLSSAFGSVSVDERSNSVIVCDTQENIEKIKLKIAKADTVKQNMFVETVMLKFLNAKNLENALKQMPSQYGSIIADETTNSVIVCDTRENIQRIIAEIKKADQTPQQIMIEVVIMDVQLEDDTEVGVNWTKLFEDKRDIVYNQTLIDPDVGTIFPGAALGIRKDSLSGTILALQEKQNVEILASPRVMVLSGWTAQIKTVEEIPYQETNESSDGGILTSTVFKEVGVTLKVKATLTDDGKIMMTIEPSQSARTSNSLEGVPVVDTRSATTTLLIDDGQAVVLGGLRKKEIMDTEQQVPFFGNLPLIGWLFSNTRKVVNESELVVFISPHIYKGQPLTPDQMEKFQQLDQRPQLSLPKTGNAQIELLK